MKNRKYEFRARLWQSFSVVAITAAFILSTVGCGEVFRQPKHTGSCTVAARDGGALIMERGNHEVFVMHFHNEHPYLPSGTRLDDVLYEDNGRDSQYFVKAILAHGETLIQPKSEVQPTHVNCAKSGCVLENYSPNTIFYSSTGSN